MKDPAPPIAHTGTLANAPWAAIVGHIAKKGLTGRLELEVGSFVHAVHFENGAPVALLSGELDADTPEPLGTLADKIAELAKSPGTARYVFHDGADAVKRDAKTPSKACDPFAIVISALAKAPPTKVVSAAIATIGDRTLAKAKTLPDDASLKAALDRGPQTVAALIEGASAADKTKRELEIYALLVIGAIGTRERSDRESEIEAGDAPVARPAKPGAPAAARIAPPKPPESASKLGAVKPAAPPVPKAAPKPPPPKPAPPIAHAAKVEEKVEEPIEAKIEDKPVVVETSDDDIDVVVSVPPAMVAALAGAPVGDVAITVAEIKVDADGLDAQAHYEKAYKVLSSGSIEETDAALAKALALDPTHPDAVTLAIWLDVRREKDPTDGALQDFVEKLDEVIKRAPRCERAFFYRGSLYKRLGKTARATEDFETAAELNPRSVSLARGLQLVKDDAPAPMPKAMPTPGLPFAPAPPVDPAVARRRRITIMATLVVVLGSVAGYLLRPQPPPADAPDFSWVPSAGPAPDQH